MFRSNILSKSVWKHFFYHKNTEKSKKCRKLVPKGGAQGGPRMWFSEILGFLGPPGGVIVYYSYMSQLQLFLNVCMH